MQSSTNMRYTACLLTSLGARRPPLSLKADAGRGGSSSVCLLTAAHTICIPTDLHPTYDHLRDSTGREPPFPLITPQTTSIPPHSTTLNS
jgi:hypothetical protein